MKEFTCDLCAETFTTLRSEEEAEKEYLDWLKENPRMINDEKGVICHDCYQEFNKWYLSLTPMDKLIIEQDFIKEN